MSNYCGATERELRSSSPLRRIAATANQRLLFPHRGRLELTDTALVLHGWRSLTRDDIRAIYQTFDEVYGRVTGAGGRGGFSSLGVISRWGAPIRIELTSGERLYLHLNFRAMPGVTDNREWLAKLRTWYRAQPPG